ncbi:MAG: 50S ribosomal protein L11 methyltransferase [Acidimicrobiia bacterium]|nr:50S ribosomal protein L11 methyltransferase [Acidimicrobiia bacterium]
MTSSADAIEVMLAADDVDLASGLLWSVGVSAVAEHPLAERRVLLRTDVPPTGVDGVRAALSGVDAEVALVSVDDGLDAWREFAEVVHAGRRLVVRPSWLPLGRLAPDAVVVEIDPERSWGHGAHPTTRLCLAEVERVCDDAESSNIVGGLAVLDVGCGSGALSIAAALLGAESVVACDIDPAAVAATRRNAERNGVAHRIEVHLLAPPPTLGRRIDVDSTPTGSAVDSGDPLGGIDVRADLIVANIGAAALVDLAPHLLRRIAVDGVIVVSGLLDPPPDDVAAAFSPLQVQRSESLDGWTALVLR